MEFHWMNERMLSRVVKWMWKDAVAATDEFERSFPHERVCTSFPIHGGCRST